MRQSLARLLPPQMLPGRDGLVKIGVVMLSGLLYGITIASIRLASAYIPPTTLTTLRLIVASAALTAIVYRSSLRFRWRPKDIANISLISVLTISVPFFFMAMAVRYISSILAAVLCNLTPPFTVLLAHFLAESEELNLAKVSGTMVSVAGATILLASNSSGLMEGGAQAWVGQLLVVILSLTSALGIIHARNAFRQVSAFTLAHGQVLVSLLIFLPIFLFTAETAELATYPPRAWLGMVVSALAAPVAAFSLMFYIIEKYSASLAGFASITTPLFSVLIGLLFMGETVTWTMLLGSTLLMLGVWSINHF